MIPIRVEPGDIHKPVILSRFPDLTVLKKFTPMQIRVRQAQMNEPGSKVEKPLAPEIKIPIEPGQLIVLAIGVVVSSLRTSHFIAAGQHRHALR